jgi:hypothetical protein
LREIDRDFLEEKKSDLDFILKCQNPNFFMEHVLAYDLSSFHKDINDSALKERYLVVEIPRGHLKTTLMSKGYPIWRLWKEKNYELCLTSSSLQQSIKIMNEVQTLLETNPFLKHLVPTNRDFIWNKQQTFTTNGNQYYVKPFNDSARGAQPNIIVYDDILRIEDSEVTNEDIENIFWGTFMPMGQTKRSQHILIGTPRSVGDLFDDIEAKAKNNKLWKHIKYPCVTIDEFGVWKEPLWKERFTIEELKEIQSNISPFRFSREYLCDPLADGSSLFSRQRLSEALDHSSEFTFDREPGMVIIGLDIAFSKEVSSDYTVLTVANLLQQPYEIKQIIDGKEVFRTIEQPILIKRIDRMKGTDIDLIESRYNSFQAQKITIDKSTGGVLIGKDLRDRGLSVDEQSFEPINRKSLLLNLWKIIDQGRLVFPYKEGGNSEQMVKICHAELFGMQSGRTKTDAETFISTTKNDDCVMSLALAVKDFSRKVNYNEQLVFSATSKLFNKPILNKEITSNSNPFNSTVIRLPGL